jgi:hypothetical protein
MRQHADTFAKATVHRVFAAVPGLNNNDLRARFAGTTPPPGSTWKPPVPDPPVRAQEEARMGQAHAHQAAQKAQMEAYFCAGAGELARGRAAPVPGLGARAYALV